MQPRYRVAPRLRRRQTNGARRFPVVTSELSNLALNSQLNFYCAIRPLDGKVRCSFWRLGVAGYGRTHDRGGDWPERPERRRRKPLLARSTSEREWPDGVVPPPGWWRN